MTTTSEFLSDQFGQRENTPMDLASSDTLDCELDDMRRRAVADLQSFLDGALTGASTADAPAAQRPRAVQVHEAR